MLKAPQAYTALTAIRDELADLDAELMTNPEGGSWVKVRSGDYHIEIIPPCEDDAPRADSLLASQITRIHFRDREVFLVCAAATDEDDAMTGQALARAALVPGIVRDLLTRQPHDDRSSLNMVIPR